MNKFDEAIDKLLNSPEAKADRELLSHFKPGDFVEVFGYFYYLSPAGSRGYFTAIMSEGTWNNLPKIVQRFIGTPIMISVTADDLVKMGAKVVDRL